jgi:hypothetical protein
MGLTARATHPPKPRMASARIVPFQRARTHSALAPGEHTGGLPPPPRPPNGPTCIHMGLTARATHPTKPRPSVALPPHTHYIPQPHQPKPRLPSSLGNPRACHRLRANQCNPPPPRFRSRTPHLAPREHTWGRTRPTPTQRQARVPLGARHPVPNAPPPNKAADVIRADCPPTNPRPPVAPPPEPPHACVPATLASSPPHPPPITTADFEVDPLTPRTHDGNRPFPPGYTAYIARKTSC